jgi:hypothetical protein
MSDQPNYQRNPKVEELLRQACESALADLKSACDGKVPATDRHFEALANRTREKLFAQATLGLWAEFGVHTAEDIAGVKVSYAFRNEVDKVNRVVSPRFDFRATKLPLLVVE